MVRHCYDEFEPDALSWWDSVQFILGGRRVLVTWRHPRHVYQEMIDDAAMKAVRHLYEPVNRTPFEGAEKCYQKVGRSRKKIQGYVPIRRPGWQARFEALSVEKARLSKESEFSVMPSFKVETVSWCRFVNIVAPIEVRYIEELRMLAKLVRRILKGETILEQEFPGYVYGKAQWVSEGLAGQPLGIVSHRIAGT